jgi:hypothetical protein
MLDHILVGSVVVGPRAGSEKMVSSPGARRNGDETIAVRSFSIHREMPD